MQYSQAETVKCFDKLLSNVKLKKDTGLMANGDSGEILAVFVGDSRIRQLYYERSKVRDKINNYSREIVSWAIMVYNRKQEDFKSKCASSNLM